MSKTVEILWLYNDLLDLYGERGNISAITYQLNYNKIPYNITEESIFDELSFDKYDFIYLSAGKDKNILRVLEHLLPYKKQLIEAIDKDVCVLVTGNANLLFGKSIMDEDGNEHEALNLFEYTGKITGKVFINDFIATTDFCNEKTYGFINRTSIIENNNDYPLFKIVYSQNEIGATEGNLYRNYFGTYALGPILAKNPHILKEILKCILKDYQFVMDDSLMKTAYQKTIEEFK